jgi:hypothetical protein
MLIVISMWDVENTIIFLSRNFKLAFLSLSIQVKCVSLSRWVNFMGEKKVLSIGVEM